MSPNTNLNKRELAEMISRKLWQGDEAQYVPVQEYIEEIISLLNFLCKHQQYEKYASRFLGKYTQVNGALAEVRVSYFLEKIGFIIVEWEPPGAGNHEGEFIVKTGDSSKIFVEVKAPTWEGELTDEEKIGERKKQMKNLHAEARFVDPVSLIKKAIDKAAPKFKDDQLNLLAVASYLSFMPPFEMPRDIFEPCIKDELLKMNIENLSGIFILGIENLGKGNKYKSFYIRNPNVKSISSLPKEVEARLSVKNNEAFFR
jgi:hypothetical protein